jgi:D-psicose/D-tagatose/L-ribulose 3-epimerase
VQVIVFGSSGACQVPEGFSKKEAFEQLVDFGKRAGPEARSRNITIAIEPQRREESNIINTTAEELAWVKAVNHPNIQLMMDYDHFSVEKKIPPSFRRSRAICGICTWPIPTTGSCR